MSNTIIKDEQAFINTYDNFERSLEKIKDIFDKQNNTFDSINETEIWTNELRFDTSLIDKIEKCENESIKHHFEELLKKQQNMPSKSKEKIKEYYI